MTENSIYNGDTYGVDEYSKVSEEYASQLAELPSSNDGDWSAMFCEDVGKIPSNQQCDFVVSKCGEYQIGILNYYNIYYCKLESKSYKNIIMLPSISIILLYLFISLGYTAGEHLCPNLSSISNYLKIPENISGLTLLAFGNGSPDILSTYSSFQSSNASLAVGELIGAAFFITCFIIGSIAIAQPFSLTSIQLSPDLGEDSAKLMIMNDKAVYIRDLSFFGLSITLVLVCLIDGKLTTAKLLLLVSVYVLYVVAILLWQFFLNTHKSRLIQDYRIRNLYDDNTTLDLTSDGLEFEDSYSFNLNILNNIEFGSILNNLTKKQSIKFKLSRFSAYRDDTQEYESRLLDQEINLDEDDELNNGAILETNDDEEDNIFKKAFNLMVLPISTALKVTVPLMTYDRYHVNVKFNKSEMASLLMSIFLSQFVFIFSFIETPTWLIYLASMSFCTCLTYVAFKHFTEMETQSNNLKLVISILGFITAISCIAIIAEELINALKFISVLTHLSDAILGLTIFAIGNSVGDLISNLIISQLGYPLMALAACFGGPLLNLLLGIGLNGLIIGNLIKVDVSPSLISSCFFILLNLLFIGVYVPYNAWRFDRFVGFVMISIWGFGTFVNILIEIFT
ncbi:hypothetical protein CANARDRAFT_6513 [[Candida] arabinofermentans NRRL YB-2248]|uniref:Sodium/calcium exchanger membrane region domain-containing protein n=1 Tax=[Candida] arabinofermentans NRRL YB-2248 TaxID=983967 RepID=A0A1E4T5A3_9ASCO|nr:hypothetical protein CANARDRAFT_6513 [[Candida] arabinofermentans NRRL YB-2248]